ncbi:MAG: response regulator transcription factor [Chloroflexota bacterium]|nr:response regulator transcription factor [Chloroflexota bacterium]
MAETRVLIIDDEPAIARAVRPALQGQGFVVAVAETGADGLAQWESWEPHLILLDLGLPDMDGVAVVRAIRKRATTPVLVLSVRGADRDKIAALDNGADDYLTKPFSIGELLARVRVALRHSSAEPAVVTPDTPLAVGDLLLDPERHLVTQRGAPIHLSPTEFNLLALLMAHPGKVITHRTILHKVWGPEYASETQLLRVYIGQLRGKLEARPERPTYILTEPGIGYRFQSAE